VENRELGLVEIFERVKAKKDDLGLVSFKRTPTSPIDPNKLPAVLMFENIDLIVKKSSRHKLGYPARRKLEVILEIIVNTKNTSIDMKTLFRQLRLVVFTNRDEENPQLDPNVADGVFLDENRTEGPIGYGLPDVIGTKLVLDLFYTDNGL
jgi:hypothetical protein